MKALTDSSLQNSLKTLFDAGYLDFNENKVMIETNPGMCIGDIMACIDISKQENGLNLENVKAESSDDAIDFGDNEEEEEEEDLMNKNYNRVMQVREKREKIEKECEQALAEFM